MCVIIITNNYYEPTKMTGITLFTFAILAVLLVALNRSLTKEEAKQSTRIVKGRILSGF